MNLIHQLSNILSTNTLPGIDAHKKLAPIGRNLGNPVPSDAERAAVMILLFKKSDIWHTLLIVRESTNPFDKHKGQMSFPGGRFDSRDVIMQETALRELHEEVGIPKNEVTVIGELTDIYIPVSNYHVFPFIGFISSEHPRWVIQESEVEDVLEVPLSTLQDPNTFCLSSIDINEKLTLPLVPSFVIDNRIIWGATAMIMSEFLDLLNSVEIEAIKEAI